MKILNLYYGIDAFNFHAEPHHCAVRYNVYEEEVLAYKEKAKQALQNKKCFWWLLHVVEVSPKTGESVHQTFFDSVPEKEKIILNAKAKQNKASLPKPSLGTLNLAALDGLMANLPGDAPWPAPWVLKAKPTPEPAADTPIPF